MKIDCNWGGKLKFAALSNNFKIEMDATKPFSDGLAPTPMEYILAGLCGCTGMDVLSILNKKKQSVDKFILNAEASVRTTHPHIFTEIKLKYFIDGDCASSAATEAVYLSQTKYCSVSAMLSCSCPINYDIILNGKTINQGKTEFKEQELF